MINRESLVINKEYLVVQNLLEFKEKSKDNFIQFDRVKPGQRVIILKYMDRGETTYILCNSSDEKDICLSTELIDEIVNTSETTNTSETVTQQTTQQEATDKSTDEATDEVTDNLLSEDLNTDVVKSNGINNNTKVADVEQKASKREIKISGIIPKDKTRVILKKSIYNKDKKNNKKNSSINIDNIDHRTKYIMGDNYKYVIIKNIIDKVLNKISTLDTMKLEEIEKFEEEIIKKYF